MSQSPIDTLQQVMERLRNPETGCPWDKEQTFETILPYTIEEAYEVADAIEQNNMQSLQDELGDLLLQVIYHAQIAKEKGLFDFEAITQTVTNKMIRRHPHVFGDENADHAKDVDTIWEQQKEKEQKNYSALDNVTKGLPALLRAQKLQKKAAKKGFEWPDTDLAFEKIEEEIHEFKDAKTHNHREEELGDLLFCLVNYARMNGLNSEESLRKANKKFIKRFQGMERVVEETNVDFSNLTLEEMLTLWNKQKCNKDN